MNHVSYCHVERWWAPMLTQINSKNKFHREYRQMVYGGALSTEWLLISSSSRKTWFDWHNADLGQWVKFLDVFKQPCRVLSTKASGASSKAGRVPSHVFIKSGLYTRFKVQQFRQTTNTWDLRRCYLTFLWKGGYRPCSRRKTNGSHKAKWESFWNYVKVTKHVFSSFFPLHHWWTSSGDHLIYFSNLNFCPHPHPQRLPIVSVCACACTHTPVHSQARTQARKLPLLTNSLSSLLMNTSWVKSLSLRFSVNCAIKSHGSQHVTFMSRDRKIYRNFLLPLWSDFFPWLLVYLFLLIFLSYPLLSCFLCWPHLIFLASQH